MWFDYYRLLGIGRDASQEEVKRAYYAQARECHPDRNLSSTGKATELFKQLGEAYAVLSDKRKRAEYDRFRTTVGGYETDESARELVRPLKISLEELYTGTTKMVQVKRTALTGRTVEESLSVKVPAGTKAGTRIRLPGAGNERKGKVRRDVVFEVVEEKHGVLEREGDDLCVTVRVKDLETAKAETVFVRHLDGRLVHLPFPEDASGATVKGRVQGEGIPTGKEGEKGDLVVYWEFAEVYEDTRPLKVALEELYTGTSKAIKCTRKLPVQQTLALPISKGAQNGDRLRLVGGGREHKHGPPDDVVFVLKERSHAIFRRVGDELHLAVKVDLDEPDRPARLVKTLDGRFVRLDEPDGVGMPESSRLEGEGMPARVGEEKGALVVHWEYVGGVRTEPASGGSQSRLTTDRSRSASTLFDDTVTDDEWKGTLQRFVFRSTLRSMDLSKIEPDPPKEPDGRGPYIGAPVDLDWPNPERSPSELRALRARAPLQEEAEKPREYVRPLRLTLREMYEGTTKKIETVRRTAAGGLEQRVLKVRVPPGCGKGKARFKAAGDELEDGEAADIVFVMEQVADERFQREGDDLVMRVRISALVARASAMHGRKMVEHLDGRRLLVPVPKGEGDEVNWARDSVVEGEGMPVRGEGERKRGDLIVRWEVEKEE